MTKIDKMTKEERIECLKKGKATRLAKKKAREATRESLNEGYVLYKDCEPGIGWVVEKLSNGHKKYYMTPDQAKDMFYKIYKGSY